MSEATSVTGMDLLGLVLVMAHEIRYWFTSYETDRNERRLE